MKCIFIILDGLGDRPIKELGNLTPLEAANTPNMDFLAQQGDCGMLLPVGLGIAPESGPAHFEIFGYSPFSDFYPGRGPLEALGTGFDLKENDLAFRVNFATLENNKIIDRRAGRIKDVSIFEKDLSFELNGVQFIFKAGTEHRGALILRGENLSKELTDSDPRQENLPPLEIKPLSPTADFTAMILNEYLRKTNEILSEHSVNKKREKDGLLAANYLLLRGAGFFKEIEPFNEKYNLKSCCIAGAGLYKGIAKFLKMDLITTQEATGAKDTNIKNKISKAKEMIDDYDFIWVHIKAVDLFGHDGDFVGKTEILEKIDKNLEIIKNTDCLKIITGDHSTPCEIKDHSSDPVSLLISGHGIQKETMEKFGEKNCENGKLGTMIGKDLMPKIKDLMAEH
ncbi:MAG: 2,3-bisphosphoglycerate-independent phosphoglycerate mutase [bacterium]|nr:2,3-bisphosphoglycerate-independent phosphoglycerate mutase [bacterium]